jgi:hypothetical protein
MIQSFMTSGSLTWGAEPDEGPDESDVAPFPEENAVMMVSGGHPLFERCHMSSQGPRIPSRGRWSHEGSRV